MSEFRKAPRAELLGWRSSLLGWRPLLVGFQEKTTNHLDTELKLGIQISANSPEALMKDFNAFSVDPIWQTISLLPMIEHFSWDDFTS